MIRTKLAKKVLTTREQRHLTESGIHSMRAFVKTRKHQHEQTRKNLQDGMPIGLAQACYECKVIAAKLGLE
jgi:hypothetical protein